MTAPTRESPVRVPPVAKAAQTGLLLMLAHRGAPIVLLAVTAMLGGYRLGAKSVWHDEAFTVAVARSDSADFWWALLDKESFSGLYYSILRLLPALWDSEATLRLPSVVFAALTTISCYAIGRRLFGFRVAVMAAVLLNVNLLFLRYAQEARAYTLVLWLATLSSWQLTRAVQCPTWPRWLGYGAIAASGAYAHFFAVFLVAGHVLSLVLHHSLVPWRKAVTAAGLFVFLVFPLSVVLLSTNAGGRPLLAQVSVPTLIRELAGIAPTSLGIVQGATYAGCCIALVLHVRRQRRRLPSAFLRWRYTMLLCWILVPILLAALVSIEWPIFVTRYFMVCLPAVVMLVAVGLGMLRPLVQVAVLLVVVLLAVPGLRAYYLQESKEGENWRGLVQYVAAKARAGDQVIFLSRFGRRPFEYYLVRDPDAASALMPAYPSLPWGEYPPVVGERNVAAARTDAHVLKAAAPPRVWAVLLWGGFRTGDDDGVPFEQLLAEDYTRREHHVFGRYLKLALYERRPDFPVHEKRRE